MSESTRPAVRGGTGEAAAGTDIPVWLAYVLLIFTALSWASSSVAGRAASATVPPYALSFIRWGVAFLIYLPFGGPILWRQRRLLARHFPLMCAFSLFGVVGFTVPYYAGLQFTPAVNATLMNGSGPIMMLILAYLMLGTRITPPQVAGIVLAIVGTVAIVFRGRPGGLMALQLNVGDVLVLVSYFSWALYTVMLRWRPKGMDQLAFLVALCGIAALMMLPMYLWEVAQGRSFAYTRTSLLIIGYSALVPSVIAYICWNLAINKLGANRASFTQYLIPVFGVILAVIILGESLLWYHVVGIGCIFLGIYLASRTRRETEG